MVGQEAIQDVITLLKSGEKILEGGIIGKIMGIFEGAKALFNLINNIGKLKAAVQAMLSGGLGVYQCDEYAKVMAGMNMQ